MPQAVAGLGNEHPSVRRIRLSYALATQDGGNLDGAQAQLDAFFASGPEAGPDVAFAQGLLGSLLLERGDLQRAKERLEAAWKHYGEPSAHPMVQADLAFLGLALR